MSDDRPRQTSQLRERALDQPGGDAHPQLTGQELIEEKSSACVETLPPLRHRCALLLGCHRRKRQQALDPLGQ
jgi:hypothetical protein